MGAVLSHTVITLLDVLCIAVAVVLRSPRILFDVLVITAQLLTLTGALGIDVATCCIWYPCRILRSAIYSIIYQKRGVDEGSYITRLHRFLTNTPDEEYEPGPLTELWSAVCSEASDVKQELHSIIAEVQSAWDHSPSIWLKAPVEHMWEEKRRYDSDGAYCAPVPLG